MLSFAYPGSNLKITETVRDLRRVPSVPHTLQGSPAKYLKAISPDPSVQCTALIPVFAIFAKRL